MAPLWVSLCYREFKQRPWQGSLGYRFRGGGESFCIALFWIPLDKRHKSLVLFGSTSTFLTEAKPRNTYLLCSRPNTVLNFLKHQQYLFHPSMSYSLKFVDLHKSKKSKKVYKQRNTQNLLNSIQGH